MSVCKLSARSQEREERRPKIKTINKDVSEDGDETSVKETYILAKCPTQFPLWLRTLTSMKREKNCSSFFYSDEKGEQAGWTNNVLLGAD